MAINTNRASIIYQATTALLSKTIAAVRTRNKKERKKLYAEAAKIRYALKALTFYSTYIDAEEANQILQCLIVTSGIQDYPVPPVTSAPSNPVSTTAITGPQGEQGPRGNDGGATDFAASVNGSMVVDSFAISSAYAARWDYIINGTAQRAGTVYATWTEDGAAVEFSEISTPDANGSTSAVTFTVTHSASTIRLNAVVTSGTWEIRGSRYFIPNQGATVVPSSTPLPLGNVFVGNASNIAAASTAIFVNAGNIGIGTTTPTGKLTVAADQSVNNQFLRLEATEAGNNISYSLGVLNGSSNLRIYDHTANTTRITLTSSGDLGVGVTTPAAKLDINGTIKISGGSPGLGKVLTSDANGLASWQTVVGTGTVTSVNADGGTTGLGFINGPIVSNGTLSLVGTLSYAHGGTNQTFYTQGDIIYASAANTLAKRAIGIGGQILTVSSGVPTWSSNIAVNGTAQIAGGIDTSGSGTYYKTKVVAIGSWDMVATASVSVAHGLTLSKIRAVNILINNDAATTKVPFDIDFAANAVDSGSYSVQATNIVLTRNVSGLFNFPGVYESTASSRGDIVIFYEA